MKRTILTFACLLLLSHLTAQDAIQQVLQLIEQNNKELQANMQLNNAQKQANKSDNNLADPEVVYTQTFSSPHQSGKGSTELNVVQGFDFPTAYASRHKLNKLKASALDMQYAAIRRDILLQAQNQCLDLIRLNQEKELLQKRLNNARKLTEIFNRRLQTGDANALETNKIRLELMKIEADVAANESARVNALQALAALNGNQPILFEETSYAIADQLPELPLLKQEVLPTYIELQELENQSKVAKQQITVDKSGWLPKLQVGYRRNTGAGEKFNGFIVGGSIPLFNNHHKVKAAKAQALSTSLQKENATLQAEATLTALYYEVTQIEATLKAYNLDIVKQNVELLDQALENRQIGLTDYFTEMNSNIQTWMDYLQWENQYHRLRAEIYKNSL